MPLRLPGASGPLPEPQAGQSSASQVVASTLARAWYGRGRTAPSGQVLQTDEDFESCPEAHMSTRSEP